MASKKTTLQFEKMLGVDASIWLGIEADYQLQCRGSRRHPRL
jgi:plasmid maintenance system antidote protein VapI